MKHKSLTKQWWLLALISMASCHLYGLTVWNNDPAIAADVVDDDLLIIGTNQLIDHIHIVALTQDVLVTVSGGPAVVRSEDNLTTSTQGLHFFADTDLTITVSLTEDLLFSGSHTDLLITFSGGGNLVFMLEGGNTLTFGADGDRAPAIFAVNMDQLTHSPDPRSVIFRRFPIGSLDDATENAIVQVTDGGRILFMSTSAAGSADTATIGWDASTNGSGRLELFIGNTGGVLVGGRSISTLDDPTIFDLNINAAAGGRANFEAFNSQPLVADSYSGFLIVNNNSQMPVILANPWCETDVCPDDGCTIDSFPGFIVDQFGQITIADETYIDYIGTATNVTPDPTIPADILDGRGETSVIKDRNPSALFVDGTQTGTQRAQFIFEGNSAFYFRSGVDDEGNVSPTAFDPSTGDVVLSYTIDPENQTVGLNGAGQIVLDVEGQLDVIAADFDGGKAINILSLFVTPTGGSVLIEETDTNFPLRTFARDANGDYLQYNAAAFLINSRMNFYGVNLQHTDEIHQIFEKNFPELQALYMGNVPEQSSPTYIGGESWTLCGDRPRPTMAFYQTNFLLHTDAALSGVDLKVPDYDAEPSGIYPVVDPTNNTVNFIFYYNGRCIDNGTGTALVLGSIIGSLASDLNTIVNPDAHLDVMQEHPNPMAVHVLNLDTAANNTKVTEGITGDITNQFAVNTIYLGNASNISIGTNGATGIDITTGLPFALSSFPTVNIASNYFSFETQGGTLRQPEASLVTGEGGIFVDANGIFQVEPLNFGVFANMATTVTKSRNGVINLPKSQIFFNLRVGIGQWALNLSDPSQLVLVDFGQSLSNYTLDWKYTTKDFCGTPPGVFVPYQFTSWLPCTAPAVTDENLTSLPTIHGIVDQMQVRNSRLGDPFHLLVDAGQIRELVFLQRADSVDSITGNTTTDESGVAPTGFIVLQDDAIVGLGTAHRNLDSTRAEVVLGINGVTLIANGTGQVVLNEDTLINNVGHILTGTQFGVGGPQMLLITSVAEKELRVTNEAVLDLSQFTNENQILGIGGNVKLVFEPGARLILGGGILRIMEQAQVVFEPFLEPDFDAAVAPFDTDSFRVSISGSGRLLMTEDSRMQIFRGAYVGIESFAQCSTLTTMTWELQDNARLLIGDEANFGGVLQIGDATTDIGPAAIDFTLLLNGQGTVFNLNSQGMLGLGVGIVSKPNSAPNTWTVNTIPNVSRVAFNLQEGTFKHNQILSGDNPLASLLAIGDGPTYTFNFDVVDVDILGGGNMVHISAGSLTPVAPTVLATDINTAAFGASIMVSLPMLADNVEKGAQPVGVTAQTLFNYLKVSPFTVQMPNKFAAVFQSSLGRSTIGWISGATIRRDDIDGIIGSGGNYVSPTNSLDIGTVGIGINPDNEPLVFEINVGF